MVAELPDIDFMPEIADLFLRAAKLICMSPDPQLLSEEHAQEQEDLDDSTPFATEPRSIRRLDVSVRDDTATAGRDLRLSRDERRWPMLDAAL